MRDNLNKTIDHSQQKYSECLTKSQINLAVIIKETIGSGNCFYKSIAEISRQASYKETAIRKAIKYFISIGVLTKDMNATKVSTTYTVDKDIFNSIVSANKISTPTRAMRFKAGSVINKFLKYTDIKRIDQTVLKTLMVSANRFGTSKLTSKQIASKCGFSSRHVETALKSLAKQNIISSQIVFRKAEETTHSVNARIITNHIQNTKTKNLKEIYSNKVNDLIFASRKEENEGRTEENDTPYSNNYYLHNNYVKKPVILDKENKKESQELTTVVQQENIKTDKPKTEYKQYHSNNFKKDRITTTVIYFGSNTEKEKETQSLLHSLMRQNLITHTAKNKSIEQLMKEGLFYIDSMKNNMTEGKALSIFLNLLQKKDEKKSWKMPVGLQVNLSKTALQREEAYKKQKAEIEANFNAQQERQKNSKDIKTLKTSNDEVSSTNNIVSKPEIITRTLEANSESRDFDINAPRILSREEQLRQINSMMDGLPAKSAIGILQKNRMINPLILNEVLQSKGLS
jgi:hypothetical protein